MHFMFNNSPPPTKNPAVYEKTLKKIVQEGGQGTILCSITFSFRKSCHLWENVKKNIVEGGQATDENMAHAHCMVDT